MSKALEELREIRKKPFNWETLIKVLDDVEKELEELSKYKNLEQELGCPLEVVFKAITKGIYYEDITNRMRYNFVDLHQNLDGIFTMYCDDIEEHFLCKNYKKTWWLRDDKSE